MKLPDMKLETAQPRQPVCGIDEVGRGPWAGPVLAAAVILPPDHGIAGINDSKKLSAPKRRRLCAEILAIASVGIGAASVAEIDDINILAASHLAMCRAARNLPRNPAFALIDGNRIPNALPCPALAVIGGDGLSQSIAAASIVAKVTRDKIMADLALEHPGYGWERNAGYGVSAHRAALERLGVTPHHRRSFKPIHNMLCEER